MHDDWIVFHAWQARLCAHRQQKLARFWTSPACKNSADLDCSWEYKWLHCNLLCTYPWYGNALVFTTLLLRALPAHPLIPDSPLLFPSFGVKVFLSFINRRMSNCTIMHTDVYLRCLIPRIWRWELVVASVLCTSVSISVSISQLHMLQMHSTEVLIASASFYT